MTFVVILIILCIIWMCFGTRISQWLRARFYGYVEDRFRQQMGMPTRKEQRRREREAAKNPQSPRRPKNPYHEHPDSIIPKEYAEDVEFTEYKEYSSDASVEKVENPDGSTSTRIRIEEQVSDVEYIEIRDNNAKGNK
ncbi:MAG: hypothetical protein HDR48_05255 [Bacteroides sp.]|nr:hypothetical protein [Bacteroides sp.]MBD5419425.1 hypothetical protein [Bacteroides sp.]